MGNVQLVPLANIGTDTEQISVSGVVLVQLGIALLVLTGYTKSELDS
jgi:hypothetical protein